MDAQVKDFQLLLDVSLHQRSLHDQYHCLDIYSKPAKKKWNSRKVLVHILTLLSDFVRKLGVKKLRSNWHPSEHYFTDY